uniref:Putative secreted protein n=1 Tax=Anopheles marajoara TaxID=58244 RepID=A0A2M4CF01_9DIPT
MAGWLAGGMVDWFTGRLAGWLAGWLAAVSAATCRYIPVSLSIFSISCSTCELPPVRARCVVATPWDCR